MYAKGLGERLRRSALAAAFVAISGPVSAGTLIWNGGVGGVWQDGGAGWTSGGSPASWNNANPDDALFSGTTPESVSVSGAVTVGDITVTQGVYTIGGAGTLTLSSSLITIGPERTATVSAALAGSSGLTKDGSGTVVLSGTDKNYAGITVLSAGVIRVSAAGAGVLGATSTNGIRFAGGALHALFSANTTVAYYMEVGTPGGEVRNLGNDSQRFQFTGNRVTGSGTLTLSFGSSNTRFTLANAQNSFTGKWVIDSGGNQNRFVDMNYAGGNGFGAASGDDAITLLNSGALLVRNNLTLGSVTQGIYLGAGQAKIEAAGNSTGLIAGKISGPSANALQFYANNAQSVILLANPSNSWSGPTTINSGSAFGTVRLAAAGVIPDAGGTVEIAATARLDLNGFDESIGGLTGDGRVDNAAPASSVMLAVGGNNADTDFAGSIVNSGAGATLSLVKVGSGTWTLQSTNLMYAGPTIVSNGILEVTSATNGSLGASMSNPVVLNGGTLQSSFPSNTIFMNPVEIGPLGATLRNVGNDNQRWLLYTPAGGISGSGVVTMSFGSSITRFIVTNSQASFTGKVVIDSGGSSERLVDIYKGDALGSGAGDDAITLVNHGALILRPKVDLGNAFSGITLGSGQSYIETAGNATCVISGKITGPAVNGLLLYFETAGSQLTLTNPANNWLGATVIANNGSLRIGTSGVIPDAGSGFTLQAGTTIDLNGQREVFSGISGSGNIDNRTAGTAAMIGIGANNADTTFSGAFSNSAAGSSLAAVKVGSGTLTLSGIYHAHSTTIVSGGVLLVTGSLPSGGRADVAAGTLAGSVSVGHVTVRGGRISPAHTGVGMMETSSLTFTGGTCRIDINDAAGIPGTGWDLISVVGGSGHVTNETAANPVKIELVCGSTNLPGFDGVSGNSWKIVDAGHVSGFSPGHFTVNLQDFKPPEKSYGSFSVQSESGDLVLYFTPQTNEIDLGVAVIASTNYALSGNTVSYSITVSNNSVYTSGLYAVTSSITPNLSFTGASGGAVTSGSSVAWSLGGLAPGASTTLVVSTSPVFTGSTQELSNIIFVSVTSASGDPDGSNNTSTSSLTSVGIPAFPAWGMMALVFCIIYAGWRSRRRAVLHE